MASTGCDMSEEELLAMLKGISASKIQKESAGATSEPTLSAEELAACATADDFLSRNPEEGDFNQYWYSKISIEKLVEEVRAEAPKPFRVAFISTPSIFFSLSEEERAGCSVLDFDKKWEGVQGFVFYDFNAPEDVPEEIKHSYDMLVIDPPFISREVWEKYTITAKLLLRPEGKILLSTIDENESMMMELLGVHRNTFRPRIPNLVYQYSLYTSYESKVLGEVNPEIGF